MGGLRAARRLRLPAAPSPHPRRPCWQKLPGPPHAGAMATPAETEAYPPTDSSCESGGGGGGGGDEEMKQELPELESSSQNGGGGLSITEPGSGAGPEETAAAEATASVSQEQPQDSSEAGAAALLKGPEEPERPVRRIFQIPRKSREKKGGASPLPQPLFLSPFHLFIRICLLFPHPYETRKHACSANRLSPHCHGRPAAALGARGKRWNHAPLLPLSPWKLEVAQV